MTFPSRLNKIIKYYGLKKKDFTDLCGISKNQLYNYLKHDQLPNTKVFQSIKDNFPEIHLDWLITGTGSMLINEPDNKKKDNKSDNKIIKTNNPQELKSPETHAQKFRISDALTMTAQVLESGTSYSTALYLNIQHFSRAIRAEQRIINIEEDMKKMKEEIRKIKIQKIQEMEAKTGGEEEEKLKKSA